MKKYLGETDNPVTAWKLRMCSTAECYARTINVNILNGRKVFCNECSYHLTDAENKEVGMI